LRAKPKLAVGQHFGTGLAPSFGGPSKDSLKRQILIAEANKEMSKISSGDVTCYANLKDLSLSADARFRCLFKEESSALCPTLIRGSIE